MGEKEFRQEKELEFLQKGPWELKDYPISVNIGETYLDPFTGRPGFVYRRDPRYMELQKLVKDSNDSNFNKADIKFGLGAGAAILPKWKISYGGMGKDLLFHQEPCAYIDIGNNFDEMDKRKFIYRGRVRKDLKGKVFIIWEKGKKFYKVKDISSGKKYKLWPEDLEEVESEYVIDWAHSGASDY